MNTWSSTCPHPHEWPGKCKLKQRDNMAQYQTLVRMQWVGQWKLKTLLEELHYNIAPYKCNLAMSSKIQTQSFTPRIILENFSHGNSRTFFSNLVDNSNKLEKIWMLIKKIHLGISINHTLLLKVLKSTNLKSTYIDICQYG